MTKIFFGLAAIAMVSACSLDPKDYETEPVTIPVPKEYVPVTGKDATITCQLYTKDRVRWDRATSYPEKLTHKHADNACLNEGYRQRDGGN